MVVVEQTTYASAHTNYLIKLLKNGLGQHPAKPKDYTSTHPSINPMGRLIFPLPNNPKR